MNPITISKKQIKDDLVIIGRSEYDTLLRLAKDEYLELNDLKKSLAQARSGQVAGPFESVEDLLVSLKS